MTVTHLDAGLPDGGELVLQDVCELALADAVPVHDDPVRLVAARALVEHHEMLPHHGRQVLDDVLPLLLHSHRRSVSGNRNKFQIDKVNYACRRNYMLHSRLSLTCWGARPGCPPRRQCWASCCPRPGGESRPRPGR